MIHSATATGELGLALDKHFLACAAAAAAGVVGVADSTADAAVIYSGALDIQVDHTTPTGIYIDIDNLQAGAPSSAAPNWHLNIYNGTLGNGSKAVRLLTPDNLATPIPARDADAIGTITGNYAYVDKLGAGVTVGAGSNFVDPPAAGVDFSYLAFHSPTTGYDVSPWNGGVTGGFLGFRFTSNGETHYGWARLDIQRVDDASRPFGITLRDFAYEDVANTSIVTGAGIPEPSTGLALAVLALGAAGVRPARKRD